jgi:hypothetical protein
MEQVGGFPEESLTSGELDLMRRIRSAGFNIQFLEENPVIHWRETTFLKFFRHSKHRALENVLSLRRQRKFISSIHFTLMATAIFLGLLGMLSMFNLFPHLIVLGVVAIYFFTLLILGIIACIQNKSLSVGLGVPLLMLALHFSLILGTLGGTFKKIRK